MKKIKRILVRKKRKNERYFKYIIALFHLWLGLLSSIIIFIVCLTGSIYAFKNQILNSFIIQKNIPIAHTHNSFLENCVQTFTKEFETPNTIFIKGNSIEITSFSKNNIGAYAYFNIETNELAGIRNPSMEYFFEIILEIHRYLLVEKPGKLIVGISVLFFLYLIISGFLLWFPKKRKHFKKNLTLNFRLNRKRINYDLHRVLGVYSFLILFLIAVTGLYVSFHWFKNLNIQALGGPSININKKNIGHNDLSKKIATSFSTIFNDIIATDEQKDKKALSEILTISKNKIHKYHTIKVEFPVQKSGNYSLKFYKNTFLAASIYDEVKINEFGKISEILFFHQLKTYQKYILIAKPLHTGEIFGISSIIIYFFISIIGASLPVTGFVIWYGKASKIS